MTHHIKIRPFVSLQFVPPYVNTRAYLQPQFNHPPPLAASQERTPPYVYLGTRDNTHTHTHARTHAPTPGFTQKRCRQQQPCSAPPVPSCSSDSPRRAPVSRVVGQPGDGSRARARRQNTQQRRSNPKAGSSACGIVLSG